MSAVLTAPMPEFIGTYIAIAADIPGVATANTYFALFNPPGSGRVHVALFFAVDSYAIGVSGTAVSLTGRRITAISGGSVFTNSQIDRFISTSPDPVSQVYTSNPTVTNSSVNVSYATAPPITMGVGGNQSKSITGSPSTGNFTLYPGQGLAFGTTSGNTNQVWSFEYIWGEAKI